MILWLLAGCRGLVIVDPGDLPCPDAPLAGDDVWVGVARCEIFRPSRGEARSSDVVVANSRFRAVIRHPLDALTVHGVGGGTLVDLAPWSASDRLHEAIPLIGGGWLDVEELEIDGPVVRVAGFVAPFLDRPAVDAGAWREIAWRAEPGDPWLYLDGAEGLWLNPSGGPALYDGALWDGAVVLATDGVLVEDLGGALVYDGATRLLAATHADGLAARAGDAAQPLSGIADGASVLVLTRGEERVGRAPVVDGTFDLVVPADVTGVQAFGAGRVPSGREAPEVGLELVLGARGDIALTVDGAPRGALVRWQEASGRGGSAILGETGLLGLGGGSFDLTVEAGPAVDAAAISVFVPDGAIVPRTATVLPRFDTGAHVLAALPWRSDRSRRWRTTDNDALRVAASRGVAFVVLAPEDEVAGHAVAAGESPPARFRNGSLLVSPDGWTVLSWPWNPTARQAGHGAPPPDLPPEASLSLAWGGPGIDRFTAVDLAWLEAVGAPAAVDPHPDFVRLPAPGVDAEAWGAWFRWLDASVDLVPLGPLAWVSVGDPGNPAAADVEDGLVRGRVVATTGPLIDLVAGGRRPGDLAEPDGAATLPVVVAGHGDLDEIAIIGEGGRVLARLPGPGGAVEVADPGRWLIAVGWSDQGWAATAPVWWLKL